MLFGFNGQFHKMICPILYLAIIKLASNNLLDISIKTKINRFLHQTII
jgi:hypothetical protein